MEKEALWDWEWESKESFILPGKKDKGYQLGDVRVGWSINF